ncbi:hypothetical protein QYE76_037669 [Lolium multiflorum]|uniref:Leucine-rich repeat-containing N-terminal plant-type domain-containing protein n=1 Tax=Lolium multiflorum TaxID=4521 RepID=A0AAD8QI76_LOLMU|nr:hypothetical protein QYE76_037669 [Lolium multiflorum]
MEGASAAARQGISAPDAVRASPQPPPQPPQRIAATTTPDPLWRWGPPPPWPTPTAAAEGGTRGRVAGGARISNYPVFGNVTAVSGGSAPAAIAILTVVARPTPPPGNTSPQTSALLRLKRSFTVTNESVCTLGSWRAGTDYCHW